MRDVELETYALFQGSALAYDELGCAASMNFFISKPVTLAPFGILAVDCVYVRERRYNCGARL